MTFSSYENTTFAPTLTAFDREILAFLNTVGASTTAKVARNISRFGSNGHQQSGAALSWLRSLEKRGLVLRPDNEKPLVWVRTQEGTAALGRSE